MKQELQEELFALAPEFFKRGNLKQSLMAFGFEVGDGWFQLLKDLILDLKKMAPPDFEVVQVKEKFGTLRFYTSNFTDLVERRIRQAELDTEKTCELCGKVGKLGKEGWLSVRCKACKEGRR